jgi:predicted PurR-regulated permease PerM
MRTFVERDLQLVVAFALLWLSIQLGTVVLVVVTALLLAGTMSPLLAWMEGRGFRRDAAIAVAFSLLVMSVTSVAALTVPPILTQAGGLLEREPAFRAEIADYLALFKLTAPLSTWLRHLKYDVPKILTSDAAFAISTRILAGVAYGLTALFLAFYILIDRDRLRGGLFSIVPRSYHLRLARMILQLETVVGAYIRAQVVTCLLAATFSLALLVVARVPSALALSVFVGFADVFPYIGALLSIAPMTLVALTRGPVVASVVLVAMLLYEEFESRVLIPRIHGRALRLPSAVVLVSLLAGAALGGVVGALLALPITASVRILIEELRVELPGEPSRIASAGTPAEDQRFEEEYERRSDGVPVTEAAAIAVEITVDRRREERTA